MNDEVQLVLKKLAKYCAIEDRCNFQIRRKLQKTDLDENESNYVIQRLQEEAFLDERRYAESFVRGKFRIKQWGRMKLQQELFKKFISQNDIDHALKQIDEEEYLSTLRDLIDKKIDSTEPARLFRYLTQKGYEIPLVSLLLKEHRQIER